MKKNNIIVAVSLSIGITIMSCTKDEALTPNPSFLSSNEDIVIDASDPGPTTDLVVEQRQRAVVTYVGATWCPPCGAYGDPTKEHMESTHGSDVIILNVQSGDAISMQTAFGPSFGSVFQSSVSSNSIPHAYWSGANFAMTHRGFSSSSSANNSNADRDINAILGNTPNVGVAAKAFIEDDSVKIEALIKYYAAAADSYIGVYLLEDGVEASQQVSGLPDAIVTSHENVLRAAAYNGNTLGVESVGGGSFTESQEVLKNYTMTIPSTILDQSKLQVAVVIWETNQADGISNAILVDVN